MNNTYSMIFAYALLLALAYWTLLHHQQLHLALLLTLIVSCVYYAHRKLTTKTDFIRRLLCTELPYHLGYLAWLVVFPHLEFMYYVPLMLSSLGKLHQLLNKPSEDATAVAEELILFQSKAETYILGTLLVSCLLPTCSKLLELSAFLALCKLKYTFYFPAQKAYVELHFALDNLTRRIGGRSLYHLAYMAVSALGGLGGTRAASREIVY